MGEGAGVLQVNLVQRVNNRVAACTAAGTGVRVARGGQGVGVATGKVATVLVQRGNGQGAGGCKGHVRRPGRGHGRALGPNIELVRGMATGGL